MDEHARTVPDKKNTVAPPSEIPSKPLEALQEERKLQAGALQSLEQSEAAEAASDREAVIQAYLVEHDFLGFNPKDEGMMERLTEVLLQREQSYRRRRPSFDICQKSPKFLEKVCEKAGLGDSYADFLEQNKDQPPLDRMRLALAQAVAPEQERAKFEAYLRLTSAEVVSNEEDRKAIEAKVNALDISAGVADPVWFIQTEIFASDEISDDTKEAVAREFKISRVSVATGSELLKASAQTQVDPETGEEVYVYTKENPMTYRNGLQCYMQPDGTRMLRTQLSDGRVREIPLTTDNPNLARTFANQIALYYRLEEAGINHFMGEPYHIETGIYHQTDMGQVWKTAQVIEALLGGYAGYNGEILWDDQLDFIVWEAQWITPKGDAATGDYDINASDRNLQDLGVRDKDGKFNYDILASAGSYMRGEYLTGSPDYYTLQLYLHGLFPGLVPLTGENAQEGSEVEEQAPSA